MLARVHSQKTLAGALPRGLALFLGGFGLLNILGNVARPGFDANLWWLDLRWLAPKVSALLVFGAGSLLVAFGISLPRSRWRRWATLFSTAFLLLAALGNGLNFYWLLGRNQILSAFPIPFSLLTAAALVCIMRALLKAEVIQVQNSKVLPAIAVCFAALVLFPLLQFFCFGKTDYRRAADFTVVPGARVYADGRPSDALADRVRTACRLYQQGLTRKLLFSGGPGDGDIPETESMARMAIGLGVKAEDIVQDRAGLNTQATVKNSLAVFSQSSHPRVLVVSHFYHLPRLKLAYQRAGLDVYSVPAKESYMLGQLPYYMAREVAALWVYYLRPLRV